jgi:hypothetical protein
MKLRETSGVLCDKKILMRLKGKFYRSVVGPTMLYSSECWVVDRRIELSMNVTEMKMLRWMSGVTRKNRIKNEYVRGIIGVASIVDKMRENRNKWFRHVMRREAKAIRVIMKM